MKSQTLVILVIFLTINSSLAFKKNFFFVGGYRKIDLNNPPAGFGQIREYALNHFVEECNNNEINESVKLGETISAYVQIVAGTNYKIIFHAENYSSDHLTIVVFQSLPDENRKTHLSISQCQ